MENINFIFYTALIVIICETLFYQKKRGFVGIEMFWAQLRAILAQASNWWLILVWVLTRVQNISLSKTILNFVSQGPVVRSLVSANHWLRGNKTFWFPWYLTLVSANHAFSTRPRLIFSTLYLFSLKGGQTACIEMIECIPVGLLSRVTCLNWLFKLTDFRHFSPSVLFSYHLQYTNFL